jgi:RNA polymerase sigma factor (sigma-70 family)
MNELPAITQLIDHLFRQESGKMVAVFTKLLGLSQVDKAEDLVQETLLAALETWKLKGVPENPQAWLYRVAKNKLLNLVHREKYFSTIVTKQLKQFVEQVNENDAEDFFLDDEIEDAQLRMMFACCHPAIPDELQLILILKTLCGLNIKEIAIALLCNEDTVAKRLYRAKEKIKTEKINLDVPFGKALNERLEIVLKAIYLLFNEAYKSATTETVLRKDLCDEALRLCAMLVNRPIKSEGYDLPKINALMALLCFHVARFESRVDGNGEIILLEDQDRTLWNAFLIKQGYFYFKDSASGNQLSEYHIEAAIASYHIGAADFASTNWQAIYYCYNLLFSIKPTPIVAFNRAIAKGYAEDAAAGIAALLEIEELNQYHFYHVALGDFYKKEQQNKKAIKAYTLALQFVVLQAERKVIEGKLEMC